MYTIEAAHNPEVIRGALLATERHALGERSGIALAEALVAVILIPGWR
jgi:hypothetical protein